MLPHHSLRSLMAASYSMSSLHAAGLPVFPGMPLPVNAAAMGSLLSQAKLVAPEKSFSDAAIPDPMSSPSQLYTQSELDMLLYGYANPRSHTEAGLALSGLRLSNGSLGKSKSQNKAVKAVDDDLISNVDLPRGITIQQSSFAGLQHFSVFSSEPFSKGHMFGPYEGKTVHMSEMKTNDKNAQMWEIFKDGQLVHFVDGKGSMGGWMSFVNCARYQQEQNLDAVQVGDEVFYQASKDIAAGKELLVWYGDMYETYMGIPTGIKGNIIKAESLSHQESDSRSNEQTIDSKGYSCERCGKVFAYKYYKDKHLKYTKCVDQGDRKFPCTLCSRSFEKRDRLRIHILHVHEKHRPHKCSVCNKCFSQSSSLNKHMRVHSGERPYKCVYCNKAFTASSILRTHIRQHSGEKPFKCKYCGKAFASHAAHDSHVRRTHSKEKANESSIKEERTCTVCGKSFARQSLLDLHIKEVHGEIMEDVKDEINVTS